MEFFSIIFDFIILNLKILIDLFNLLLCYDIILNRNLIIWRAYE